MNFVRGLAGYITTASGRRLAFAWFANDLARRDATGADRSRGARHWRNAAVYHERRLLGRWATLFDAGPAVAAR
jgi:D-alanyl-D-alanine carboxypeptidase/D-alanyl-D-alanine-endopeptidase (penicillin-binding protein 4)